MMIDQTKEYKRPVELISKMSDAELAIVEDTLMNDIKFTALKSRCFLTTCCDICGIGNACSLFSELWSLVEREYERRNQKPNEV